MKMKKQMCKAKTMMAWKCSRPAIIDGYCKLHYDKKLKLDAAKKTEAEFKRRMAILINDYHGNLVLSEDKKLMTRRMNDISVVGKTSR